MTNCSCENITLFKASDAKDLIEKKLEKVKNDFAQSPLTFDDIECVYCCIDCDEVLLLMEKYTEDHRPDNQKEIVEGICINPKQRFYFNVTPNSDRPEQETEDWFGNPYIKRNVYTPTDHSYQEYVDRVSDFMDVNTTKEEWDNEEAKVKSLFDERFPEGYSYNVYCLDGGAWDRATWIGTFNTLNDALKRAKEMV